MIVCGFFFFKSMLFFSNHIPYLQLLVGVGEGGRGWLQNYFSFWPVLNWDTTKRRKSHRLNPQSGARIVLSTRKRIEHTNCCDALPSNILETNVKLTQASVISIIVACHGRFLCPFNFRKLEWTQNPWLATMNFFTIKEV